MSADDPVDRPPRPPWSQFRAALDRAGFRPSKRLGQNFLLDENAARAIARDSGVAAGDVVIEVGPGCGFLSVHLAHAGARLVAVEIDERLAEIAARFLAPYPDARVVVGDALAGKHRLGAGLLAHVPSSAPWHFVSNLPYSIAGPVLALLAGLENAPAAMTVLVQSEVADRLAARPGRAAWGPLSIAVQAAYRVASLRDVPRGSFWPRPRVESRVVRAELRAERAGAGPRRRVVALGRRLLLHRRQSLSRALRELLGDRAAAEAALAAGGWTGSTRAEELGLAELEALSRGPAGAALDRPEGSGQAS